LFGILFLSWELIPIKSHPGSPTSDESPRTPYARTVSPGIFAGNNALAFGKSPAYLVNAIDPPEF